MTIQDVIDSREIQEVVHFTTSVGLLGILDSKVVKPRIRLKKDQRLEFTTVRFAGGGGLTTACDVMSSASLAAHTI